MSVKGWIKKRQDTAPERKAKRDKKKAKRDNLKALEKSAYAGEIKRQTKAKDLKDAEVAIRKGQRKAQKKTQGKQSTTSTVSKIKKASANYVKNMDSQDKNKKTLDLDAMFGSGGKKKGGKKQNDMFGGFL